MSEQEKSRLFIAIPLPIEIKTKIYDALLSMKPHLHFRKWVHPEDYHITLFFLGDTDDDQVTQIHSAMIRAAQQVSPFRLSVGGFGTFGRSNSPRVLWIDIHGNLDKLRKLQNDIAIAMELLGYCPESRLYNPHITVARKYKEQHQFSDQHIQQIELKDLEFDVNQMTLFQTQLGEKPMYRNVHTILL